MKTIAIVEDDEFLLEEIINTFESRGMNAVGVSDLKNAVREIIKLSPDLLVLDLNLPYQNGLEICTAVKSKINMPILILTARDSLGDEICAINLGADDYLTKPCHPDRLIARAQRLLSTYEGSLNLVRAGMLTVDSVSYKVSYKGENMVLPETSGKILLTLAKAYPETAAKEELVKTLWGTGEFLDPNILEVNIARLRKSLSEIGADSAVITVRGEGYKIAEGEV
ncbi:MAG: response regulator transcription factor [Ruminococcaceae bacterium]|nr:response regulator transcription factor [Oscillospiraceae bacterium]